MILLRHGTVPKLRWGMSGQVYKVILNNQGEPAYVNLLGKETHQLKPSIFGSPSTLPPGQHAPQYTGVDRQRYRGDDFRNRSREDRSRFDRDRQRDVDWDRQSRYSDGFRSQRDRRMGDFRPERYRTLYKNKREP